MSYAAHTVTTMLMATDDIVTEASVVEAPDGDIDELLDWTVKVARDLIALADWASDVRRNRQTLAAIGSVL